MRCVFLCVTVYVCWGGCGLSVTHLVVCTVWNFSMEVIKKLRSLMRAILLHLFMSVFSFLFSSLLFSSILLSALLSSPLLFSITEEASPLSICDSNLRGASGGLTLCQPSPPPRPSLLSSLHFCKQGQLHTELPPCLHLKLPPITAVWHPHQHAQPYSALTRSPWAGRLLGREQRAAANGGEAGFDSHSS